MDFGNETRQRTSWWRNSGTGGSAGWTLARRRDDALPGGGTAAREGQQDGIWRGDKTMHLLVAERQNRRVSRMDFGEETRQHTFWWRNSGTGGSEDGLWRGDKMTHELVAERQRGGVNWMDFGEETRQRTP